MPAFGRVASFLFGRGGKKNRSTGIVIAVLGLGAMAYFLWPRTDATLQRVRRTSPDSLQAYLLKPEDRRALAEFYRVRQTLDSSMFQQWGYQQRTRLLRVGLQLTEQSMLFRWRVQNSLAQAKLDTAFQLGHMLATCARDSFLWQQAGRIKNLDAPGLKARVQVSESFAVARDVFLQPNYAEAAKRLEHTRTLAMKIGDDKFLIDASYLLQYALRQQPEHERVIALGEEILRKAQQSHYGLCLSTALVEVADAYSRLGLNDSALVILSRATAFAESMSDSTGLARCYFLQAQMHWQFGNYTEAEHSIEQVIAFDTLQRYRGQVLSLYGQIAKLRCEYDHAEKLVREALQIYHARQDSGNHAQTLIDLSILKTLLGDYVNALVWGRQALRLGLAIKDQNRATDALSQIGWIYLQADSLPQAITTLKKAITLFPRNHTRNRANTFVTLAAAYLKQEMLSEARETFLQAEEIANSGNLKIVQVESRIGQGWVALAEGHAGHAQAVFTSALDLAKRIHEENLAAQSLYGIAAAQKRLGNREEALETLERALAIGETLRTSLRDDSARVSYFSVRQDWFDDAILWASELDQPRRAFHYAERARARAMRDALLAGISARDSLNASPSNWFAIPTTEELQRQIPGNVQVLEYRVTADTLWVWLLENDKFLVQPVAITARALEDTIQHFLKSVGARDYDDFLRRCRADVALVYNENRRIGKELFRLFLGAFANELKSEKYLYIIPDGMLHLVPWGALVNQQDFFVDEKYAWSKAPSLAILVSESNVRLRPSLNFKSKLLMVAGNLASVSAQKQSLQTLFENFALLREAQANFANVQQELMAGAAIAYFSVRAVADMHQPWNSYMELAEEQTKSKWQPRKAYLRELLAWDFSKTQLLILNACETASGKIERGEGGMSMARFFTRARVPHVVASLWQNDDRISARIIDDFLRGLENGRDLIFCLQQAKRKGVQELHREYHYPLPYFWATFELYEVNFSNATHPKFN